MSAIQNILKKMKVESEDENPYLSARKTWNDYTGSIIAARRMWQIIGMTSLMIALCSVGGLLIVAKQSKFIPYIVEVDKLGNMVASSPLASTTSIDPRIIKSTLADFISNARLVTPDALLQETAIVKVYSHLVPNHPAAQKMNEWFDGSPESSPFERARKVMISSEIKSVIPQTSDTWQLEWTETIRDRNGGLVGKPINFRALMTVYLAEPSSGTTEKQIRMNPLGIYIKDYSWQKLI